MSQKKTSVGATFIVPDWGDKVDSNIGLSYLPARLHRLAGRYDNPINYIPHSGTMNLATDILKYVNVIISTCLLGNMVRMKLAKQYTVFAIFSQERSIATVAARENIATVITAR